jgi:hypothetical protein
MQIFRPKRQKDQLEPGNQIIECSLPAPLQPKKSNEEASIRPCVSGEFPDESDFPQDE